jgi:hypothetical protein
VCLFSNARSAKPSAPTRRAAAGLRWIARYNDSGVNRMQRNIFALQQYFAGYGRLG